MKMTIRRPDFRWRCLALALAMLSVVLLQFTGAGHAGTSAAMDHEAMAVSLHAADTDTRNLHGVASANRSGPETGATLCRMLCLAVTPLPDPDRLFITRILRPAAPRRAATVALNAGNTQAPAAPPPKPLRPIR